MKSIKKIYLGLAVFTLVVLSGCGSGDPDAKLDEQYKQQQASGSLLDIVKGNPELSTLLTTLNTTELDQVINDDTATYTLFAPTNDAFSALGKDTIDGLLQDPQALSQILLYHVLPDTEVNAYTALQLAGKTTLSANGIKLSINRWGQKVFVNGVAVSITDQKASNGVVHIIDKVLLPPDIQNRTVNQVKQDIVELAESYIGLSDNDFTLQSTFEPLLAELLTLAPQSPISDRIELVSQSWKQIWGPYNYNSGQQGVDPEVSFDEVYQVVSSDGYYYNVTPLQGEMGNEQIGMLRGAFTFDPDDKQCLNVRFIKFPGLAERPLGIELWDLPALEENNTIQQQTNVDRIEIVPSFVVRTFFGTGQLCEIYTDDNLRISMSREDDNPEFRKVYIMSKVTD